MIRARSRRRPYAFWFVCSGLFVCCSLRPALAGCVPPGEGSSHNGGAVAERADQGSGATSIIKAGAALTADSIPVALSEALASPGKYEGKTLRLEGTIEQVCPMRGCWLMLKDGDAQARVTFKDYGFFVPTNSRGKRIRLDAEVVRQTLSEELAVHLESETEGGNPESIHGPQEVISVIATGVEIGDDSASEE
jgi:hypothetical protein